MSNPSFSERTVILTGLESTPGTLMDVTDLAVLDHTLRAIPIYDAFNPVTPEAETQPLNRAKPSLDPEAFGIGVTSYGLNGQIYLFGSGIANLPPDYSILIQACGFKEIRLATNPLPAAGTPSAVSVGSGGSLGAGAYDYKFATLLDVLGTTAVADIEDAAFESIPSTAFSFVAVANDSATISGLPAAGIKRVYRTKVGGVAGGSTYYFIRQLADGVTGFTDTIGDTDMGREILRSSVASVTAAVATEGAAGNVNLGTHDWAYAELKQLGGAAATTNNNAAYETQLSAAFSETVTTSAKVVDLTVLPAAGIKNIYRTKAGTTTPYYFVGQTLSGATTFSDNIADVNLTQLADNEDDIAIYKPVSDYADFKSLSMISFLDSRRYPASGVRGTIDFEGNAGENVRGLFTFRGAYNTSVKAANTGQVSSPGIPPQFCAANLQLQRSDDTANPALEPALRSFRLQLGRNPVPRVDANTPDCSTRGLREFGIFTRPDPRLILTIEVDEDTDYVDHFVEGKQWSFQFQVGQDDREVVKFSNHNPAGGRQYLAQLAEAPTFDAGEGGIRLMTLNFLLAGQSNDFLTMELGRSQ